MRDAVSSEPISIDPAIMKSIELHLKTRSDDVTGIIAQFMHTFFTSSSFIETHEMDNFILKNERLLSIWQVTFSPGSILGIRTQLICKKHMEIL